MFVFLWKTIRNKDELEEFLSEDSKWYKGAYEDTNYFFWNFTQLVGDDKFIVVKTKKKIGGKIYL